MTVIQASLAAAAAATIRARGGVRSLCSSACGWDRCNLKPHRADALYIGNYLEHEGRLGNYVPADLMPLAEGLTSLQMSEVYDEVGRLVAERLRARGEVAP